MAGLDVEASAVVDAIDDALVVMSEAGEILECNEGFEAILAERDSYTGAVERVLDGFPALEARLERREEGIVPVDTGEATLFFQLSVSTLDADTDADLSLVVLHDVTDQQRRQRTLERENEHLDQFASVISHDLRNPLDVAIGRTAVVDELVDDPRVEEHLSELRASHARMNRIIQDVLTLARQGERIDDKRTVTLSNVAQSAWSHVETDGAAIDVSAVESVSADPDRLGQVFENLFRNAIEHGKSAPDDSLTVTVGTLDDGSGFYVTDDGEGIDPDVRGQVLEAGFSQNDSTGLGLAIVSKIADAHGWDVTVTESERGGARFDFIGVELVASR